MQGNKGRLRESMEINAFLLHRLPDSSWNTSATNSGYGKEARESRNGKRTFNIPETTTPSPSPPKSTASTLPKCPPHLLNVVPVSTSQRKTCLSPPTLANRALSAVTARSRTEYPCASYFWIGLVVVVAEVAAVGRARERWIERSEEPVRRYVPGKLEKDTAFTGPGNGNGKR
jgi:hypothetical protein